jgi:hypothetical protein
MVSPPSPILLIAHPLASICSDALPAIRAGMNVKTLGGACPKEAAAVGEDAEDAVRLPRRIVLCSGLGDRYVVLVLVRVYQHGPAEVEDTLCPICKRCKSLPRKLPFCGVQKSWAPRLPQAAAVEEIPKGQVVLERFLPK